MFPVSLSPVRARRKKQTNQSLPVTSKAILGSEGPLAGLVLDVTPDRGVCPINHTLPAQDHRVPAPDPFRVPCYGRMRFSTEIVSMAPRSHATPTNLA